LTNAWHYDLCACAPDASQRKLLSAALADDPTALTAWRSWRESEDIENIDSASFRLLPLIYRRLKVLAPDDPLLSRLKIVYRHTWFKNQLLVNHTQQAVDHLQQAGIETMLLKGGALVITSYADPGARHMNDMDLMVRPGDFQRAMQLLAASGWQIQGTTARRMMTARRWGFVHGCGFKLGEAELDLHAQLSRFVWQDDALVWGSSRLVEWAKREIRVLSPTLSLYHTCVHGVRWSYATLTWIPDALTLLKQEHHTIDWAQLLHVARQNRTVCQLQNALTYLECEWQAPIPASFLAQLQATPTSWVERSEYRALAEKPERAPVQLARRLWLRSCRFRQGKSEARGPIRLSPVAWLSYLALYNFAPKD
jgi:Uncharacterised nucleotidyltransferase